MSMFKDSARFWDQRKDKYPFHAEAPVSVKPHLIKHTGFTMSVVVRPGVRTWGFETAEARDKFVRDYDATSLTTEVPHG